MTEDDIWSEEQILNIIQGIKTSYPDVWLRLKESIRYGSTMIESDFRRKQEDGIAAILIMAGKIVGAPPYGRQVLPGRQVSAIIKIVFGYAKKELISQ